MNIFVDGFGIKIILIFIVYCYLKMINVKFLEIYVYYLNYWISVKCILKLIWVI